MTYSLPAYFLLTYVLVFGVYSMSVSIALQRWFRDFLSPTETLIYGMGLAPLFLSFILYYLLLAGPWSPALVVCVVLAVPLILIAINRHLIRAWWSHLARTIGSFISSKHLLDQHQSHVLRRSPEQWSRLGIAAFLFLVFCAIVISILHAPLETHDVMIYALLGDTFAAEGSIDYAKHLINESNGYYYIGLHGFGFPLLRTYDALVGQLLGIDVDLFFRAITGYYSLTILLTVVYWLKQRSWALAFIVLPLLFGSYGFLILVFKFHVDAMRMFSLLFALILFAKCLKSERPSMAELGLFGMVLGMATFVHTINVVLGGAMLLSWFIFSASHERFKRTAWVAAMMLLGGSIHYVLDIVIGTGWIFKSLLA